MLINEIKKCILMGVVMIIALVIAQEHLGIQIATVVVLLVVAIFFVCKKHKSQQQEINEIIGYMEHINRGDYFLKIDDNEEGNLSILKNEVYKTTLMLKEATEKTMQEKVLLKDSLSDISHQLKTPITSLNINLENLMDIPDMCEENRQKIIRNSMRDINNINFLVQNILKLSRLDSNTVDFNRKETSVDLIVNEAIEKVMALSDLMEIEIDNRVDGNETIICDPFWEVEAISNILKNAIEHAKKTVTIKYDDNIVCNEIIIENDGEPISDEDIPHIFERFYKGSKSSGDSVGIGLALAKAIVEKDNGYITVQNCSDIFDGSETKTTRFSMKYYKN